MNDGNAPQKRSIFSYIMPYLLLAAIIGVFVYFITANFVNRSVQWTVEQFDSYVGYRLNTETGKLEDDDLTNDYTYTAGKYKITGVSVTQVYTVTTVNGSYQGTDDSNRTVAGNFYIILETHKFDEAYTNSVILDNATATAVHLPVGQVINYYLAHYNLNTSSSALTSYTVNNPYEASFWDTWGPTLISTGIILLIGIFLFSRLARSVGGGNSAIMNFNKSPARRADQTKVKFDDVAGCDEEKAEMVELVEYLKDPKKYSAYGARLPKGVLLIGPPGTGKTLLAKAVAGEAGVPFYSISGSDFVEMYVGVGAGRVRDLFAKAKATAPCLIFIDEIDAVGRQRGAGLGGGNDEREQTLNQLLVEMDGFEPNSGILVIAATNRDDVLDPALRRAGRFDRTITVSLPDKAGREAILKVHARGKKIDPSVDFAALAKRTVGFSGADLDNVLNEAAILAVRQKKEWISTAEIDEAIDRRISGPAKSSRGLLEKERKQIAYHESGHAVIGIFLPYSDKVQKITIIPRGNTGGHVLMTPEDDRFLVTKNELIARITGLLGGRVSEEIFFGDVSTGASNDIEQATRLARLMVTEFGMSDLGPIQYERDSGSVFLGRDYASTQRNFSTQVAYEIDKAVREIIEAAHDNATKLLLEHKNDVIKVAETLLDQETITAEEIEGLLGKPQQEQPKETPEEPKPEEPKPEPKPKPKRKPKKPAETPEIPEVPEEPKDE